QGGFVGLVGTGDFLLGGAGNDLLLGGTNGFPGQTDRDLLFPNDTLIGGTGDDTLDGGNGINSLLGGLGNDLVYIRSAGDIAIELPGEGIDTLIGNQSLDLSASGNYANFEAAALFGISAINLTGNDDSQLLVGNDGASVLNVFPSPYAGLTINNVITGNGGSDTILGGAGLDYIWGDDTAGLQSGNDCLDGGTSESPTLGDTMDGGLGNDTYIVDNVNDRVLESQPIDDGGVDTVFTYVNFDPLPASDTNNVTRQPSFANLDIASFGLLENFVFMDDTLRGVGVPIRGVGNAQGNLITGNAENNVILGLGGDDTILGGVGNDSLYGDRDIETPVYDPLTGRYPSNPGAYDISSLPVLDQDLLVGVGGALENGFDSLVGGAGDDGMWGEGGDDTLIGGEGNDCLMGGTGADSMVGGVGNDVFYVDTYEDVVVELSGEGTDQMLSTVDIYKLQDNVENLTIYGAAVLGIGNDLDNDISVSQVGAWVQPVTLSGGAGDDHIEGFYGSPAGASTRNANDYLSGGSGNDYLDGGQGADILEGGLGNDTLVVDNIGDAMREYGYSGNPDVGDTDLVISSIAGAAGIDLSDTAVDGGMFIENLTMATGNANLNGSGNRLNNVITGNDGNNILNGELGNDTIYGGKGNDILDGGAGTDFLRAGGNTSHNSSEIDAITGGAGANTFDLTDGNGSDCYRNITGATADAFGTGSYAILNDAGGLILKSNPDLYGPGTTYLIQDYSAKDLTTVPGFGSGFGVFVTRNPVTSTPDPLDDLIATGPAFTTLASAQAAINTATYI
ncbi:MAG: calcium-binding protein, partial [bacterium]